MATMQTFICGPQEYSMNPENPIEIGSLWASRKGREILRIERHWFAPAVAEYPAEWCVRGHPVRGGKPLVCPVWYLLEHFRPTEANR